MKIEKYYNQSVFEFLTEGNFDHMSTYQMVEIVKKITCDFDILALSLLRDDVAEYLSERYYFRTGTDRINDFKVTKKNNRLNIRDFQYEFSFDTSNPDLADGFFKVKDSETQFRIYDLTSLIEFIGYSFQNYEVGDYGSDIYEFSKVVDAKYRELKPANYDFRDYGFIVYYPKGENIPRRQKQPLSFNGLFKVEYIGRIESFFNRLIANGYINDQHIWRDTENKNEPAKVYFWLLGKGVLKHNTPTPALICFFKEFGVTAYKDNEPTPPTDIRAVTVRGLLNTTLSPTENKHFENVFLPYLIK